MVKGVEYGVSLLIMCKHIMEYKKDQIKYAMFVKL